MNNLIGITGSAGVGKSTIARYFTMVHSYQVKAFADPLKLALVEMTGLPLKHFTDIKLKENIIPWVGKSPRQLMQTMATDYVRNMVNTEFWVLRMEQFLKNSLKQKIVIDDIRFPNEAQMIRDLGGRVIHLKRSFDHVTKQMHHVSEDGVPIGWNDIVIGSPKGATVVDTIKILESVI